jgi:hypothetical protein
VTFCLETAASSGVVPLMIGLPVEQTQVSPTPPAETGADKRRTTRVVQAVPIVVRGLDALGQSFKESTTTVMVNCNGCKYRSRHYVPKESRVSVEIRAATQGAPARVIPAKVVWVQRPRTFREIFHVALEFEVPGNVWGIQDPPEDWFRHPDDDALIAAGATSDSGAAPADMTTDASRVERREGFGDQQSASGSGDGTGARGEAHSLAGSSHAAPTSLSAEPRPAHLPAVAAPTPIGTASHASSISGGAMLTAQHGTTPRHLQHAAEEIPDEEWNPQRTCTPEVAAARDWLKPAVKAAMSRELGKLRERLQSQMRDAIGETVRAVTQVVIETVEKELIEQAAVNTAEIIVEARKACKGEAGRLNERIRQIVQETVSGQALHSHQHSDQGSAQSRQRTSDQTSGQSFGQPLGQSSGQSFGQPQQHFGRKRKKHKKGRFQQQKEPVTTQ